MNKAWFPFLLLVVLSSCYFPPYEEDLSLAVPATRKMEETAFIGPLPIDPWEFEDWDIVFYPSKDALRIRTNDFVRGFMVATNDPLVRVLFVDHDGNDYRVENWNWAEYSVENFDDKDFVFRATTIIDSDDAAIDEQLGIMVFNNQTEPPFREYIIVNQYLTRTFIPMDGVDLLIGASFFHDYMDAVRLHTLRIDSGGTYFEREYSVDPGGLNPAPVPLPAALRSGSLPGLPKDINNCFYYRLPDPPSPTNRAYLSVYDRVRREYRNFSWDNSHELQVLAEMDRRIDLVLSNGWLFSREENKGYIYNGEGELINSFVMGGLDLVFEILNLDGTYRVVFTIPIWAPVRVDKNYWEDRLFFLVYWIPTEQLADL